MYRQRVDTQDSFPPAPGSKVCRMRREGNALNGDHSLFLSRRAHGKREHENVLGA